MSDELKLFAITESLRRTAPEHLRLADSLSFEQRLAGVSVADPQFDEHVRAAVREHCGPSPAEVAAAEAERERAAAADRAAARRVRGRQWTEQDAGEAPPADVTAAYHEGLLREIGMAPVARPERREPAAPQRWPSAQLNAAWRSMPPWQARRERARWMREHAHAGGGDAA